MSMNTRNTLRNFIYDIRDVITRRKSLRIRLSRGRIILSLRIRKRRISNLEQYSVPDSIIDAILRQGRHDSAVLAPGADALRNLRKFDLSSPMDRRGLNFDDLISAIPTKPHVVVVMSMLAIGGAEKFAADLACELQSITGTTPLVIVTDQEQSQAEGWQKIDTLRPLRSSQVVFWREVFGDTSDRSYQLAQLLNVLRPKIIVVVNSRLGYDVVSQYGRGLSQFARLYTAYFSFGIHALGAGYADRFPRLTMPCARALTDNSPCARELLTRFDCLRGPGVAVLPPRLDICNQDTFGERVQARLRRNSKKDRARRWVWVSRIEKAKGTDILNEIARLRPRDEFHAFGPRHPHAQRGILSAPNIVQAGPLDSVSSADFRHFDGYIFTSLYEGMPNTPLELSQHGLPMVLSDVGGLRDTFDDSSALLVEHRSSVQATSDEFVSALEAIDAMGDEALSLLVHAAYVKAIRIHSPETYGLKVKSIFFHEH
jgi:glycosyltransferase involved in cell wall biosynthesis